MEFCPKCGGILFPKDNSFICKCGYSKNITEDEVDQYEVSEKIESSDSVIITGDEINTLPKTNVICPSCGNKEAFWWLRQTRSADEAETRFLRCTKCKHTWREYD